MAITQGSVGSRAGLGYRDPAALLSSSPHLPGMNCNLLDENMQLFAYYVPVPPPCAPSRELQCALNGLRRSPPLFCPFPCNPFPCALHTHGMYPPGPFPHRSSAAYAGPLSHSQQSDAWRGRSEGRRAPTTMVGQKQAWRIACMKVNCLLWREQGKGEFRGETIDRRNLTCSMRNGRTRSNITLQL